MSSKSMTIIRTATLLVVSAVFVVMDTQFATTQCNVDPTPECKIEFQNNLCKHVLDPVVLSIPCCIYINDKISFDECFLDVITKEFANLHLCNLPYTYLVDRANRMREYCYFGK